MKPEKRVHLAKNPHSAALVTWCGFAAVQSRKPEKDGLCRWDGAKIERFGNFDCPYCRTRVVEELGRLKDIVGDGTADIESMRADTQRLGCGDHSCCCNRPGGVGTNGGCCCEERELRRAATIWRSYALLLERMR